MSIQLYCTFLNHTLIFSKCSCLTVAFCYKLQISLSFPHPKFLSIPNSILFSHLFLLKSINPVIWSGSAGDDLMDGQFLWLRGESSHRAAVSLNLTLTFMDSTFLQRWSFFFFLSFLFNEYLTQNHFLKYIF